MPVEILNMKVLIAGDFCDNDRVSEVISTGGYESLFFSIKSVVDNADFSFVNFEFPISGNGKEQPIRKCGPNLKGQLGAIEAIKWAGFNCCTLANNHILDQGEKCLLETKNSIEAAGINTVGAGENIANASGILYLEKGGVRLAVINCCEHEFTIATDTTAGANPLNPIKQYYEIQEANQKADKVLVIVHGGHEMYQLPSPRMKETYRFFVDAGADAVVNHHQHCYSGYEVYKGKPIFYGIGNFLFDWVGKRNSIWNEGYMVKIDFTKESPSFELFPYIQCNDEATVTLMDIEKKRNFDANIAMLNDIVGNDEKLKTAVSDYYRNQSNSEIALLEPYSGRILSKLNTKGLLPSFIRRRKVASILNHVECESHRDKLIYSLRWKLNNSK